MFPAPSLPRYRLEAPGELRSLAGGCGGLRRSNAGEDESGHENGREGEVEADGCHMSRIVRRDEDVSGPEVGPGLSTSKRKTTGPRAATKSRFRDSARRCEPCFQCANSVCAGHVPCQARVVAHSDNGRSGLSPKA